ASNNIEPSFHMSGSPSKKVSIQKTLSSPGRGVGVPWPKTRSLGQGNTPNAQLAAASPSWLADTDTN
ncbi:MAG TPA: hypothetical protein VJ783_26990, partial [Pirellulales bacterium]|nr:hypothetical protein [Pirellulales bacterium]